MKPFVGFAEVVEVVQENEKKRFAMMFVGSRGDANESAIESDTRHAEPENEAQIESETNRAIAQFEATQSRGLDAKQFFIRATQGHSMKSVETENLLTPITLENPTSVLDAVVHGTFYGSWEQILRSGGLKSMKRNHVHFATGPRLQDLLPAEEISTLTETEVNSDRKNDNDSEAKGNEMAQPLEHLPDLLGKNKVISGMRSDAQILIYVDIRRALAEEKDMKWWRSENGVILTDGVAAPNSEDDKLVPMKYFLAAVEVKEGLGLLYTAGKGVVKELPERLKGRGVPRGRSGGPRGGRGKGRG